MRALREMLMPGTPVTDRAGGAHRGEIASHSTTVKLSTSLKKLSGSSGVLCFCTVL